MASIERTAYPRFRRVVSARELADLTPTAEDVAWARQRCRSDEHLLALVVSLRCFGRLGYFPRSEDVPAAVVDHVRRCLKLADAHRPGAWDADGQASPHAGARAPACGLRSAARSRGRRGGDQGGGAGQEPSAGSDQRRAGDARQVVVGAARVLDAWTRSRRGSVTTSTPRCSSVSARGSRCPTGSPWRACSMSTGRAPRARFTVSSKQPGARRGRRFASRSPTCAGSTRSATRMHGWRGSRSRRSRTSRVRRWPPTPA